VVGDTRAQLIAELEERIARKCDHFALFAVPFDAPAVAVRGAFANISRRLTPLDADSKRVVGALAQAAAVLSDPERRAVYMSSLALARGTERNPTIPPITALRTVTEAPPPDLQAIWGRFAEARDKNAIAAQTRQALTAASTNDPIQATYYLACVARDLDNHREALRLYQRVLHLAPDHHEARRDVAEMKKGEKKGGILDRFRR
jgi:hypothetical protein